MEHICYCFRAKKTIKNSNGQMQRQYAYFGNKYALSHTTEATEFEQQRIHKTLAVYHASQISRVILIALIETIRALMRKLGFSDR